jgi:hypothetical protein
MIPVSCALCSAGLQRVFLIVWIMWPALGWHLRESASADVYTHRLILLHHPRARLIAGFITSGYSEM